MFLPSLESSPSLPSNEKIKLLLLFPIASLPFPKKASEDRRGKSFEIRKGRKTAFPYCILVRFPISRRSGLRSKGFCGGFAPPNPLLRKWRTPERKFPFSEKNGLRGLHPPEEKGHFHGKVLQFLPHRKLRPHSLGW